MATSDIGKQIDDLIDAERWPAARVLIQKALKKEPDNHWLLTQLAETYYEQRQYKKALELLLRSRDILPDCPLTLWHLAGTLDALGDHAGAISLYSWLLQSKKTPTDDPCWESEAWTNALKTDCVYRMGLCFKHQHDNKRAEYCLRKYLSLLMLGGQGSYPLEEVRQHLLALIATEPAAVEHQLQETADWLMHEAGENTLPSAPPELDRQRLLQLQEA